MPQELGHQKKYEAEPSRGQVGVWGQKAVGTTRKVYRTGMFRGSIAESERGAEGECSWGRGDQEEKLQAVNEGP